MMLQNIYYCCLISGLLFFGTSCAEPETRDAHPVMDIELSEENLERHIAELASDRYMGRMPMTEGGQLTLEYLVNELEDIGIEPGNFDSWFQEVELVEVTSASGDQLEVRGGDEPLTFDFGPEYVIYSQLLEDEITVSDAEIVFCGYGVVAPEYGWNDYEGIDMEGKIALVLVNDPGYAIGDEDMFTGEAMTYYGRWTYKYEEAARQGAAGVIIVHEDAAAGYPWTVVERSWSGPKMQLDLPPGTVVRAPLQGWVTSDVASRLIEAGGLDEAELFERAKSPDFQPVPLGLEISATMRNTFERGVSQNVVGIIPGSERPEEYIIYSSHWDHLGVGAPVDGDSIYSGAVDNATGIAILLEIARSVQQMEEAPARSLVFLFVTAEEQGLLGSSYYANNPLYPTNQTVANINVDGIYPFGPTNDFLVIGYDQSEMTDWAKKIAETQHRYVTPDQEPEKGFFYRSDQFSFAKVGVPALYGLGGTDLMDGGTELGEELRQRYNQERYHAPGDVYDPETWDLGGISQDGQFFLRVGVKLADSEDWPEWSDHSEFRAIREADLIEVEDY
jgi:Zn-dependent M28 family amino/carboxypeptidase